MTALDDKERKKLFPSLAQVINCIERLKEEWPKYKEEYLNEA